jgi:hypothetical protein
MAWTREELESRTVNELQELAREAELHGFSTLRKSELVDRLLAYQEESAETVHGDDEGFSEIGEPDDSGVIGVPANEPESLETIVAAPPPKVAESDRVLPLQSLRASAREDQVADLMQQYYEGRRSGLRIVDLPEAPDDVIEEVLSQLPGGAAKHICFGRGSQR